MAGENSFIWQAQNGVGGSRSAVASNDVNDVLSFNDTGRVIGDGLVGYITEYDVDFRRAAPENEAVDVDNNEIQDMGVDGLDVQIIALCGNTDNDAVTNPVNKLSLWLQDGNTVTGFTKGRYGLELGNAPQWNVEPSTTFGMHLRDVNFKYLGERKDICQVTIRLALGGAITNAI